MVDALIAVAVEGILKRVISVVTNEVVLAWGYKDNLTALHETLEMVHAKLRDAEKQKGTQEAVTLWLTNLNDVVHEADDVIDEVHYETLRREVQKRDRMARKVPSLPSLKKLAFRREMGRKIENISKKLSRINKLANELGLENEHASPCPQGDLLMETDSYLDDFKIVGREDDELHIIQLLTQSKEEEKFTIVPIVGMGGIGKTTLAKSVYNNPKIKEEFDVRAWLCVSVKVDINTLLEKIYESLTGKKSEVQTREVLIGNLRKELGAKRYLLVLDDVWDEKQQHWDDFRSCMLKLNSQNGSGILVTTRNLEIGTNIAMTKDFCTLRGLSDDHGWSIFKERAFVVGRSPSPELEEIGLDIVKKCCGLPLVVKVMGSMLRYYNEKDKWLSIKDSNVWDLEGGERVLNTLKLSFDNLPNPIVKQCFAYCSIFEKDTILYREQIIQLWMALGFLQADKMRNKEMEDVGNDIFQTLVSNSLFQDVVMDEYGYIVGCKMHDMVHDLSLSLSKHESLCLVGSTSDDTRISQVKHLAVYRNENTLLLGEMVSKAGMTDRFIHTLSFTGRVENEISVQNLKCLRILNLSRCVRLLRIHDSIGELVHLRYLNLSHTDIFYLPKSIGKLHHLQTLKLKISSLFELPKDVINLINLRHFEFCPHFIFPKVGHLTSLQTLSSFGVGKEKGCQIEELGRLKNLRGKLIIDHLEEVTSLEDAVKANLSGKIGLLDVEFRWVENTSANRNDKDVLEGLQPHANMKSLRFVNFYGDNFPGWAMKMSINIGEKWTPLEKLVKLAFCGCHCHDLPVLENLPLLRNLVLKDMDNLTCLSSSVRNDVTGSLKDKPLSPSLRSLELISMKSLEKWTNAITNSSWMLSPVLNKLYIYNCPKIVLLDEHHHHPLISLEINRCENLESIRSIQGLTSLESLEIILCPNLLGIPDLHSQCHSLRRLQINHCDKITSLPSGFDHLAVVNSLSLGDFSDKLHSFPSLHGIEKMKNHLHSLELNGLYHWESIPEEIKHLNVLNSLQICGFGMKELPMWLTNMSSIRDIGFYCCDELDTEAVLRGAPKQVDVISINGGEVFIRKSDG